MVNINIAAPKRVRAINAYKPLGPLLMKPLIHEIIKIIQLISAHMPRILNHLFFNLKNASATKAAMLMVYDMVLPKALICCNMI